MKRKDNKHNRRKKNEEKLENGNEMCEVRSDVLYHRSLHYTCELFEGDPEVRFSDISKAEKKSKRSCEAESEIYAA